MGVRHGSRRGDSGGIWAAPLLWLGAGVAGAVGTVLVATSAATGTIAVPVAIQQLLDRHRTGAGISDAGLVGLVVALAALVLTVSALSAYLLTSRLVRRSEVLLDDVRVRAFRHLAEQPADAPAHPETARRMVDDIERASHFIRWGGPSLLTNAAQLAVALVVMVLYSWKLTAVAATTLLPILACLHIYRRSSHSGFFAIRRRSLEVRAAITEVVMRSQWAHTDEERRVVQARAEHAAGLRRASQVRSSRIKALALAAGEVTAGVALTAVLVAGAALGAASQMTLGQLAAFLLVMVATIAPLQVVLGALGEGRRAVAAWRRVGRRCFGSVVRPPAARQET
ncbi:ABC transporter transmembrane domain-containing protein [Phytohabitans sp. ZYX-F-186]|uniref:ABC transporter transmembrane domain-containing protein n=1 Tax=Phytohabitans maris TaxID=3071409 RepID=A0ABU0ZJL7_9ACTN|nr:ABC transporter transmembrane domain-containing protein [Phytohabitans sp. ZYX-F-186]MDQ7906142.1 ABC transporter transmembrane domain-containing protein [Phytohabitans sp. ZYX-F-186]